MSTNRIQKLLFSEYCDFEDMVLVESPFAQTTRDGRGIRQVNLGLTPTKLVLATDILPPAKEATISYLPGVDPEIETFELVAVYPVECLNLSIFHRRKRQSLKAHFCNNRILYFELGGFEKRQMFWNLWCERVKFLSPEDPGSSHSETSVATSSSNSTLYLLATKRIFTDSGIPQIWCKFGVGNVSNKIPKWTDRYLYLGKNLDESPMNYTPVMKPLSVSQFIKPNKKALTKTIFSMPTLHNNPLESKLQMIKRFGSGVPEGCASGLFIAITESSNSIIKQRSFTDNQSGDDTIPLDSESDEKRSFYEAVENAVRLWELSRDINPNVINRSRHRRRYGFSPQPHFLNGLGPWSVSPGERFSVQTKRASSCVRIQRQPPEPELRLPVSKKQLTTSISYENLNLHDKLAIDTFKTTLKKPVVFFWTPDYWYRPRSSRDAYHEMLGHLTKLREYCQNKTKETKKGKKRFFKSKKKDIMADSEDDGANDQRKRKSIISAFFNVPRDVTSGIEMKHPQETSLEYLRRILRVEIALSAWDFDSTTLACQLTLIDRDLFLKIPSLELATLLSQQSSKNAPNIGALQAFSHRISCLVATEILNTDSEKIRARLIARIINTAEKCHKLSNFQSCKSILCGLQSPAVYRLHSSWTYLRKRHATKYQLFESLCRLYRDPRLPGYQKAFHRASLERPFLPYIGDLLARLLGKVPQYSTLTLAQVPSHRHVSTSTRITSQHTSQSKSSNTSSIRKLLSTLRIFPESSEQITVGVTESTQTAESDSNSRVNKLNKAIEYLENGQRAAAAYTMQENDIAKEFLLKARYREDRENFINSLFVEKPRWDDSEYAYNY